MKHEHREHFQVDVAYPDRQPDAFEMLRAIHEDLEIIMANQTDVLTALSTVSTDLDALIAQGSTPEDLQSIVDAVDALDVKIKAALTPVAPAPA